MAVEIWKLKQYGRCEGCRLEQCTREYDMAREEQGIGDIGPTPESCRLARAYQKCVGSTSKSCRGDINFHFVVSMLERLITRHDCVNLLHKPPKGSNGSVTEASVTAAGRTPPPASSSAAPEHRLHHPHPHTCTFNGRHRSPVTVCRFRHCGLFGDPHLKTFDNEYQTCRVRGAWPLIDNPYLAVQVTNEPVVEGSPATATTKHRGAGYEDFRKVLTRIMLAIKLSPLHLTSATPNGEGERGGWAGGVVPTSRKYKISPSLPWHDLSER
uniref:Uncharacterized protein n=1 Tax=Timema poppense TaxID=170557 RepID=A0A7R9H4Z6_TIMPO|nr:unnamed protein product [Timema poppensis]